MISNKRILTSIIIIFVIFGLSFGFSAAYFLTDVSGNDTASSVNLKTANIALNLIDGPDVTISNVGPGATIEKTLVVSNPSGVSFLYGLVWEAVANGFSNQNLLTYSVACTSYSDYSDLDTPDDPSECTGVGSQNSPNSTETQVDIIGSASVPAYGAQKYTLTLEVSSDIPAGVIVSFTATFGIKTLPIYGVTFSNAIAGTRTDEAEGLTYTVNASTIDSDFDTADIYRDITEVTDSYGNVFVKIPKFYIKKTKTAGNVWTYQISKGMHDASYYLPECFKNQGTSETLDYVLIGKYNASLNATKLESKSGSTPLLSTNITNSRTYATNNGASYQLLDIHTIDMLQALFYVEFATLDSQTVMAGYTDGSAAATSGTTNSVTTASGSPTSNSTGAYAMKYRGIENLYGNIYQFIDGINMNSDQAYIAKNPANYAVNVFTGEYISIGYVNGASGGYPLEMGYDSNQPYANFPTLISGGYETSLYKDYYGPAYGGSRTMLFGGWWTDNINAGITLWYCTDVSDAPSNTGSRLVKKAY